MADIVLGDTVEDLIQGFRGTAIARYDYLTRCRQIEVVPLFKPHDVAGELETGQFDEEILKVIKPSKLHHLRIVPTLPEKDRIVLGAEVQDIITGMKGIAVARKFDINGLTQIQIAHKANKEGNYVREDVFVNENQLTQRGEGIVKEIEKKRADAEKEVEKKGKKKKKIFDNGPMRRKRSNYFRKVKE